MLKHTQITFELLIDYDLYLVIEKSMRGGISSIMHRYSKANNKY